ncbi:SDR family NAD(P)-dependent oxidoreductase [Actinomadura sp. WAC 06369]|uniref:SDR family NAD(P)-dependent oxidoreductase n=1 Tax=Actinomadura sp. WAC 06369 TaxID=2203193 RepID=UPI000F766113|nr:SDR family oxidoreductase [Actinomadura sp. WAC 06369]RSN60179.1 3-ketoacyl-ACP reductase [Actinomadura sp. WAC 06369]
MLKDRTLKDRTALVTGGSRGIGRAVVARLAADGARVVFGYREDEEAAAALVRQLGGRAVAVRADQEDPGTIDALFEPVGERLDILVNNAAINPHRPIAETSGADFDRVMTVNAKYPLLAMRRAEPLMPDGGRIVNVSTLNTVVPAPGHALYSASKAALEQLTAVAAREFGPRGITVNAVSPGTTDTDLFRETNPQGTTEQVAAFTALGRIGRPDDIANVVAFLAGPDAAWITGQNLRATGGLLV